MLKNKGILISGAGIAGLTLAYWLKKYGFNPVIVEHSSTLREGGYAIDFFGAGFDVAEKMGILPDLELVDLNIQELIFIDKDNVKKGALNFHRIRRRLKGRAFNLLRSDLSRVIYNNLAEDIEFVFGDSITKIDQNADEVKVTFNSGKTRSFDLLIGADGLHSNVRTLVFGNESQFEKYYGYYTASFTINNYLRKGNSFVAYNSPGKQTSIYSLSENKLAALFIFGSSEKLIHHYLDVDSQKEILRDEFEKEEWECPSLLAKMDTANDFYFDSVSQIKMSHWSDGRVTLVGDSCCCPSLLSGQGSTLAMVGAYVLAGELKMANGRYNVAFEQYEKSMKPLIDRKQKLAQGFAGSLVPKSNFGIWLRNTFTSAVFSSFVAKWLVSKFMTDKIDLKKY